MTQEQTTLSGDPADEVYVGFGAAEIAYLLSRYEGESVRISTEVMGLTTEPSEEFLAAGASSLLARGWLEAVEDNLEVVGPAAVCAYGLAAAQHWTQVGFMVDAEQAADGALIVQAAEVVMLLSPRALGTWYMMVKDPDVGVSDSVLALADDFAGGQPGGAVFLGARTVDWTATLFLRKVGSDDWELARGDAPFWEASAVEPATGDEAKAALAQLLDANLTPA